MWMEEEGVLRFCFSHLSCGLWLCALVSRGARSAHHQPATSPADGVMLADVELPEVIPTSTIDSCAYNVRRVPHSPAYLSKDLFVVVESE